MSGEQSSNPVFTGEPSDKPVAPGDPAAVTQAAETVAGQVVDMPLLVKPDVRRTTVTIGDALEASARTAGRKPVNRCEAVAIKTAQYRATGSTIGELAEMADYALAYNEGVVGNQGKIDLADILTGAKARLTADKVSTFEDVDEIMAAALRYMSPVNPSEVAASVMEAVRENVKGRYDFRS